MFGGALGVLGCWFCSVISVDGWLGCVSFADLFLFWLSLSFFLVSVGVCDCVGVVYEEIDDREAMPRFASWGGYV